MPAWGRAALSLVPAQGRGMAAIPWDHCPHKAQAAGHRGERAALGPLCQLADGASFIFKVLMAMQKTVCMAQVQGRSPTPQQQVFSHGHLGAMQMCVTGFITTTFGQSQLLHVRPLLTHLGHGC